jgi:hypothetical protein
VAGAAGLVALAVAGGVLVWKRTSAVPLAPAVVTAAPSPAASPPAARRAAEPTPLIPAAELPAPGKTVRAAAATAVNVARSRRPPPSARIKAKPEAAPAAVPETRAPDAPRPSRSVADTDDAIDPFRESR